MDNKFYSKNRVNYFEKIKDNSLTVSVKVGDNEPKVINLCK